jgi:glycerophosphoryl diester phosphodiesterase
MPSEAFRGGRWSAEERPRPLILAHRGASATLTENTLAAFRRAMAEGADGVELDVQLCATGEVMVFHDESLARLAGRPERLASLPFAVLREVELRGGGQIPTLDQALETCGATALVNVEIKYDGLRPAGCGALVTAVAAIVARADAARRVLVSSFSPTVVWLWRRLRADVPCGLLFERPRRFRRPWPLRTDCALPLVRPDAVHPEQGLCTVTAVARWRRRGYAVHAWTVDEPERARELAALTLAALSLTPRSTDG